MAMHITSNSTLNTNIWAFTYRGQWYGNQSYNVDFSVGTDGGMAKCVLAVVGFSHYNTAYQVNHAGWHYVYGGSYLNANTIKNDTTGNSGAFSFSCPSSGSFRLTKSSGTYGGIGFVTACIWSAQ